MKKLIAPLILILSCIALTSCDGSSDPAPKRKSADEILKEDIRIRAKMECQQDKLREKMDNGDATATAEYEKIKKEADDFDRKMEAKYKDKEKDTAFAAKAMKYMLEAQADCK